MGGFTGRFITDALEKDGLKTDFTPVTADTRINVKIKAEEETEINGKGPAVTPAEIATFKEKFAHLTADDVVIFAGSLVPNLDDDFYFELIKIIQEKGAQFVIDTTGESLRKALQEKPLVVKPNNHELAELFGVEFSGIDDIIKYAQKLREMGAQYVMISMAGDGGLLVTADGVYRSLAPQGTVVNSVGAGDSMLAGFTGTYADTHDPVEAFRYGLASGSATAFSEDLATRAKIDEILPQIKITKIG